MIRVGVAEAHVIVRAGVRSVLETAGDIAVVGEASDGESTLHLVRTESPAVLTLGLVMQGLSGMHLIREIRQASPLQGSSLLLGRRKPELQANASRRGPRASSPRPALHTSCLQPFERLRPAAFT